MHSHNLPLLAVLWLPLTLSLLGRLPRLRAGWRRLDPPAQGAVLLLCVAAAVHLALIPAHAADRVTAVLFALDVAGLVAVALAAVLGLPLWRPAAAALLLGAIGAYAVYIAAGREVLDLTGIATKVAEIAGVELLVLSRIIGNRGAIRRARYQPRRAGGDV